MNTRPLAAIIMGISVSIPCSADFLGYGTTGLDTSTQDRTGVTVIRVYAVFDSADDEVLSISGTTEAPQIIITPCTSFRHTAPLGIAQNLPVNAGAVAEFPELALDTFLTLGVPTGYVGSPVLPTIFEFDLQAFNGDTPSGNHAVVSTGGWFIPGPATAPARPFPPPNAAPPIGDGVFEYCRNVPGTGCASRALFGVLIGQFAFAYADGCVVTASVGQLSVRESGTVRTVVSEETDFSFQSDGTPRGACCLPDGTCTETYEISCAQAGGVHFGLASLCGAWSCACAADLDGSGNVDFADLLSVIDAWGACTFAPCYEDLDGSTSVGFSDVLRLIEAWGPCS